MGRIKTAQIKRLSDELLKEHSDKFNDNFYQNKKNVRELTDVESKKLTNVISGQITKLVKNKEVL